MKEFPGQQGWSRSNVLYMRRLADVWSDETEFVQQPVGRLPWGHITILLDKLTTREDRDWYSCYVPGRMKPRYNSPSPALTLLSLSPIMRASLQTPKPHYPIQKNSRPS